MTRELPSGAMLHGKYIIERVLGAGGFGITYYARHAALHKYFAIKELFISGFCVRITQNPDIHLQGMTRELFDTYRKKFENEARTLASLEHPNIVKVTDIFDENGTTYMVMPFIEGVTLQKLVNNLGKRPFAVAVNYMGQVCKALDYLHARKPESILHRDVKPDNIMITPDNRAILIDFGSARTFVAEKTQSHTTAFTPGYAPLEQYTNTSAVGPYTDIYAVGASYYFIVTGKRPMEATERLLHELPEPKTLAPKLSDNANRTILKAMAIKPANRYQNVDKLMCELAGKDWNNSPRSRKKTEDEQEPDDKQKPDDKTDSKKTKNLKILKFTVIIAVVALLAGGGIWINLKNREKKIYNGMIAEMLHGQAEKTMVFLRGNTVYLQPPPDHALYIENVFYCVDRWQQVAKDSIHHIGTNDSVFCYTGQMKDGYPHGEGKAHWFADDRYLEYTGSFEKGKRNGNGKAIWENGYYYNGKWENGYYEGQWQNDAPWGEGKGTLRGTDATGRNFDYEGGIKNGNLRHGKGTSIFHKNNMVDAIYTGDYVDDLAHGRGKYEHSTGWYYDGEWAYDKVHGTGIYSDAQGRKYTATYENGNLIKMTEIK